MISFSCAGCAFDRSLATARGERSSRKRHMSPSFSVAWCPIIHAAPATMSQTKPKVRRHT
jgi:hypothetical protein